MGRSWDEALISCCQIQTSLTRIDYTIDFNNSESFKLHV